MIGPVIPRRSKSIGWRALPRSVEFVGAPGAVRSAVSAVGSPTMPSPNRRGAVLVPDAFADDVMAALEGRGWRLELLGEVLPL